MAQTWKERATFIFLGVIVHFIYFASVFDIYFKSPIIQHVTSTSPLEYWTSNRIVFFVADGLPAEKAFHQKYEQYTKFLSDVINKEGVWGVSHTRVPTESRVGHVSIFSGTYEDVSAITNGWKDNPVEFDQIFSKTKKSFAWGSPDILNIFSKHSPTLEAFSYDADEIDFAGKNPSNLDSWVFDEVRKFFKSKQEKNIPENRVIYFLHLLGLDTNGHAQKPDSPQYLENLRIVGDGVKNISETISNFFNNDGKTTFILTSDHGMTPWGAHGTGLPSETETPFFAWGSGINGPEKRKDINKDTQSLLWGLKDIKRRDLKQVDIPSLLSFLLGVSIPVNSVGTLPVDILDVTDDVKIDALFVNVQQILQLYSSHEEKVKKSSFLFKRFPEVDETFALPAFVGKMKKAGRHLPIDDVIKLYRSIIEKALRGIMYYHQYNKIFFSIVVNAGFLLWIVFLLLTVFEQCTKLARQKKVSSRIMFLFNFLSVFLFTLYAIYSRSLLESVLVIYPIIMIIQLCAKLSTIKNVSNILCQDCMVEQLFKDGVFVILVLIFIEFLVFAFFHRQILSVVTCFFAMLPFRLIIRNKTLDGSDKFLCMLWIISNIVLSIFPQLPVITRDENYALVFLASLIVGSITLVYSFIDKSRNGIVFGALTFILVLSLVVKLDVVLHIKNGLGLPFYDQLFSWSALILLPFACYLTPSTSFARLIAVNFSLFIIYVLLSISYDALFLVVLSFTMLLWTLMENRMFSSKSCSNIPETKQSLKKDHVRIVLMFTFFLYLSFFGTGNIASVNSFDIASMYCFQTVFSPFVQGFIVFVKYLIPFTIVNMYFRTLQNITDLPVYGCFLLILFIGDIMAVNFFFLMKVEGSWLDIGQSLSHFIISLVMVCVSAPVYSLSYYVTGRVQLDRIKLHKF